jgi:hypothetical protein
VAGGVVLLRIRSASPKVREVEATITFVDPSARRASIETTHPKSGAAVEVNGEVPPECTITINGQPADLADLRVGDSAVVRGRVLRQPEEDSKKRAKRFIADSILVTR